MARVTGRHAVPGTDPVPGVLGLLVVLFAVAVPAGVLVVLTAQVVRTGNVSHWPWEEHGVLGWWAVPASLWLAAACARARTPRGRGARLLVAVAAVTSLALLYNP